MKIYKQIYTTKYNNNYKQAFNQFIKKKNFDNYFTAFTAVVQTVIYNCNISTITITFTDNCTAHTKDNEVLLSNTYLKKPSLKNLLKMIDSFLYALSDKLITKNNMHYLMGNVNNYYPPFSFKYIQFLLSKKYSKNITKLFSLYFFNNSRVELVKRKYCYNYMQSICKNADVKFKYNSFEEYNNDRFIKHYKQIFKMVNLMIKPVLQYVQNYQLAYFSKNHHTIIEQEIFLTSLSITQTKTMKDAMCNYLTSDINETKLLLLSDPLISFTSEQWKKITVAYKGFNLEGAEKQRQKSCELSSEFSEEK